MNAKDLKIEFINPQKLTPYVKNAKLHPTEQIDKIAGQIAAFGFDQPIVVDKDYVIIKGHGRREAALRLNLDRVPVVVAAHLDEHQAMAARIADNKVAESGWDKELLRFDIHTLDSINLDLQLTGFNQSDLDLLMAPLGQPAPSDDRMAEWQGMPEFDQPNAMSFRHVIVHMNNQEDVDAFFRLIGQEDTGKSKSIWFPHAKQSRDLKSMTYADE